VVGPPPTPPVGKSCPDVSSIVEPRGPDEKEEREGRVRKSYLHRRGHVDYSHEPN